MKSYITIITAFILVGLFFYKINPNELNLRGGNKSVPDYDMYVFSLQWGNTACLQDSSCSKKLYNVQDNIMLMKVMMPWSSKKGKLQKCNQDKDISIVGSDEIFNLAKQYWPSLENKGNDDFWSDVYNTFGYCYTYKYNYNEYKYYFKNALEVYQNKNMSTLISTITNNATTTISISLEDLMNTLNTTLGGKYYSLSCKTISDKQYLQEIRLALDNDFNYTEMKDKWQSKSCKKKSNITIPISN